MRRVMKGEAYNEHIFSIYSAYIEHILKARGRNGERARKERGKSEEGTRTERGKKDMRWCEGCNAAGQRRALNACTTIRRWKRRTQDTC